MSAPAQPADGASRRRRTPIQRRSRERVEAILAAAHALVVEQGSDALTMSEIASRAGVPIGSLYQYFPDKPAILRELALADMGRVRRMIVDVLTGVRDRADALDRVDRLLEAYYRSFVDQPAVRDVWSAAQADKEFAALDIEDSRVNGAVIHEHLAPLVPERDRERLRTVTFLVAHVSGAAARLAVGVGPQEGERVMAEYRAAVRAHLDSVLA